jgi:hypothetical protein
VYGLGEQKTPKSFVAACDAAAALTRCAAREARSASRSRDADTSRRLLSAALFLSLIAQLQLREKPTRPAYNYFPSLHIGGQEPSQ